MLIHYVLPVAFCLVPVGGAVMIFAAVPPEARGHYIEHMTGIDWLILGLGTVLFACQMLLTYRALQWRGDGFDERPDPWLTHLAQTAEWFPLLGLIGTVAAILQTFTRAGELEPKQIIQLYGPAITATGSGLFMALVNITPTWVALLGRDLIRALAGRDDTAKEGAAK